MILYQKALLKKNKAIHIVLLTSLGVILVFISEAAFHVTKFLFNDRTYFKSWESFWKISLSFFLLIFLISLCIAIQLKTRKTWIVVILIFAILFLFTISFVA